MNLIENHEFYVSNQVSPLVEHAPENFRRHNKAGCFWVDLDITSKDSDRR